MPSKICQIHPILCWDVASCSSQNVFYLQSSEIHPAFKVQASLANLRSFSPDQLLSHQEHLTENRERQVNLKKDLAEMQEWMTQVDEEFLMRDFEYKSPEELEASLEEMKVGVKCERFEKRRGFP